MIGKIKRFFGKLILNRRYSICRICQKWTEFSVIEGDICSIECVAKERGWK